MVVADVPLEEAAPFCDAARIAEIDPILFVSQTTSPERLEMILEVAGGFVYLVAAMGVTGVREGIAPETISCIQNLKERTALPVVPGFGISTPEQVQICAEAGADGVIIGSAIIRLIGEHSGYPAAGEKEIRTLVRETEGRGWDFLTDSMVRSIERATHSTEVIVSLSLTTFQSDYRIPDTMHCYGRGQDGL